MEQRLQWVERWGSFITGVFIGLLIVGPVLAAPTDLAVVSDHLLQSMLALASVGIVIVTVLAAFSAARSRSRGREWHSTRGPNPMP